MRRAGGAHDVVDPALVVAALGEHPHARVGEPAHRLAALRAQLALARRRARRAGALAGRRSCAILSPCFPRRRARPPAASAMLPPTSPRTAGRSPTPTSTASSDEVAAGLRARGVARGRRRRARPAAGPGVPARVPRAPRSSARSPPGQRPAVARRSATTVLDRAGPRLVLAAAGLEPRRVGGRRRRSSTPSDADAPVARGAPRPRRGAGAARRPRPAGRDHLHVGHDRRAEGRAVHEPPARVHHPDRRRRHLGRRHPQLHRHVVRAPRLHDQAARQPAARRDELHHARGGAPTPRCDWSSASG